MGGRRSAPGQLQLATQACVFIFVQKRALLFTFNQPLVMLLTWSKMLLTVFYNTHFSIQSSLFLSTSHTLYSSSHCGLNCGSLFIALTQNAFSVHIIYISCIGFHSNSTTTKTVYLKSILHIYILFKKQLNRHAKKLFTWCIARKNIRCDVDRKTG